VWIDQQQDSTGFLVAAIFGIVAGMIHFSWAPGHFAEANGQGLFFMALGTAQVAWGVWMLTRPGMWTWIFGPAIAISSILVYCMSLVLAPPFSGEGVPEAFSYDGLFTKIVEGLTIVGLVVGLLRPRPVSAGSLAGALKLLGIGLVLGLVAGGAAWGIGQVIGDVLPFLKDAGGHSHTHAHTHAHMSMPHVAGFLRLW
jgi:hypothetical protein